MHVTRVNAQLRKVELTAVVTGRSRWPSGDARGCARIPGRESTTAGQEEPRGEPVRPGVPAPPHQGATGAQAQERGSLAGRES